MHSFDNLIQGCIAFTLDALREAQERIEEELHASGATRLVIASRVIELQKAISAVGMFSMFDAELQSTLGSVDGFRSAERILDDQGEDLLKKEFHDLQLAVNVLKHGRGRSYDLLVQEAHRLPFRIKHPGESFFFEGDVSEVDTIVQVDDAFVRSCAEVIWKISEVIRKAKCRDASLVVPSDV